MAKPVTPHIQRQLPVFGSRVKAWFDKASKDLLIESETGAITRDTYGICPEDVLFDAEIMGRDPVSRIFNIDMREDFLRDLKRDCPGSCLR